MAKFKIGQWVECTTNDYAKRGGNFKKGDILRIRKIERKFKPCIGDLNFYGDSVNSWYNSDNFKLSKDPLQHLNKVSRLETVE